MRIHAPHILDSPDPIKAVKHLRRTNPFTKLLREFPLKEGSDIKLLRADVGRQCYVIPRGCKSFQRLEGNVQAGNYHLALQKIAGVYTGKIDYLRLFGKRPLLDLNCESYQVLWEVEWNEGTMFNHRHFRIIKPHSGVYREFAKYLIRTPTREKKRPKLS